MDMYIISLQFVIATLMVQQMKSVTSLMEVVFAQMGTMENYANLVSTYCKKLCQLPMKVRENLSWDDLG